MTAIDFAASDIKAAHAPAAGEPYIIFASETTTADVRAFLAHHAIPHKVLRGQYKSVREDAFLVPACYYGTLATQPAGTLPGIVDAILARQESVLVLGPIGRNGFRPATLHFLAPGVLPVSLGYFVTTPPDEAVRADAYTYDPATGEYFVCRHFSGEAHKRV